MAAKKQKKLKIFESAKFKIESTSEYAGCACTYMNMMYRCEYASETWQYVRKCMCVHNYNVQMKHEYERVSVHT